VQEGSDVSKVCEKCGKKPVAGRTYARRGLAKYKGGVGRKVTGITNRTFSPNIQIVRVREPNGTVHRVRLCAKCLKTATRKGTIIKASRKPRPPKKIAAPAPAAVVDAQADQDEQAFGEGVGESVQEQPSAEVPPDDEMSDDEMSDDGMPDDEMPDDEEPTV
jgi:large subunit ribosomal protein L28